MRKTDVLIIGAGPAGSACGISLLKAGVDCLVADKAMFPRMKLCGGLFTKKGQDCLHDILGDEAWRECMEESVMGREENFAMWHNYELVVRVKLDNKMVLIDRPTFDSFLVQHYKKIGGAMIEGDGLKSVDFDAHRATLESGEEIEYKRLVAADGVNSTVGHLLAKADKRYKYSDENGFCIEVFVDEEDCDIEDVNIYFNLVPEAYAWVFKKGKKHAIGLGARIKKKHDLRKVQLEFMKRLGVRNIDKYPLRGALIPSEVRPSEWKHADVLFAGDAGGFVELLTYEGIYYALRSGQLAAESISKGVAYSKLVKPIYNKMKHGSFFQRFFFWDPFFKVFSKYGHSHGRFVAQFYTENIDNIPSVPLWKQFVVIVFKTVRTLIKNR